ncbi:MAG TPA: hypothetical protein VF529_12000 [Solirubrobacteraceae bacterium]|jgi:hypothetical protein
MSHGQLSSSRPEPAFLNRNDERDLVERRVELLHREPERLSVIELLGLAGSGKSRLLDELHRGLATEHFGTREVVSVSLEPERWVTAAGPLRALREQLSIDCLLFDTALLALWRAAGQRFQVERTSLLARSPVLAALDLESSVLEVPFQFAVELSLPARLAVTVFERLNRSVTRLRRYDRGEFRAIDDLERDYAGLLERLPHLLGIDVRRGLEASGDVLVAFYDSYEKQRPDTLADGAPWLRRFIDTVGRGLHVVGTCEPLRWPPGVASDAVETVLVGRLPEQHARELLRGCFGGLPPAIEDRILTASERMPFFLQTIGETYELMAAAGASVDVDDLPASSDALPRLIKHLPSEQRNLAIAVASVQVFDEELFAYLVHRLNLQVDIFEFQPFTERFFVERIADEPYALHKTHDLLTASVRTSGDERVKRAALEQATTHLVVRCQLDGASSHQAVLALFLAVVAGWHACDAMSPASAEALVDAGYLLYDAGYWNELASIATGTSESDGRPVAVVCRFFAALATRRIVGIERARERFRELAPEAAVLGRHGRSVELEAAYLDELAGDYAGAREQFARLNPPVDDFDPHDRMQLRARLWHADMLIMDGALREGSRQLLEAYELLGQGAPLDWAELVRHRAHAFRYSFALETAERLYRQAMRAVPEVKALQGKLETNLVETLCWCDPERALDAAECATAINGGLENRIELAKCEAARAIALARLRDFTAAEAAIGAAHEHAGAVGYRAGTAFALQAEAVAAGLAGDNDGLLDALGRLDDAVATLGTYGHLCVAPAALLAGSARLREAIGAVEWLEEKELPRRLRTYLRPMPARNLGE